MELSLANLRGMAAEIVCLKSENDSLRMAVVNADNATADALQLAEASQERSRDLAMQIVALNHKLDRLRSRCRSMSMAIHRDNLERGGDMAAEFISAKAVT